MEDVSDDDFVDDVDGDDMANNMLMAAKDDDLATLRALIARGGLFWHFPRPHAPQPPPAPPPSAELHACYAQAPCAP